ncbi:hypothetical protein O181_014010 [Austropuccinia psidii MF-1]|uniref:C-CAP/cofactor C-like domain-containing protein n=1 Tax=Austropuccinia psidii MF-1 TaxID=1389203 RepID=A0A9Q3GPI1_9BASI|nr:hypothetical protein [Austropuccinia psidii MF-1]
MNSSRTEGSEGRSPERKKFGFSKQVPPTAISTKCITAASTSSNQSRVQILSDPLDLQQSSKCQLFIRPNPAILASPLESLTLADLSHQVIDLRPLSPSLSALKLARLNHTVLLSPPLSSSAFCTQVSNSLIILAAQQVRIYCSSHVVLLIHSQTSPVLESSDKLTLAPYPSHLFPISSIEPMTSRHDSPIDFDFPDRSSGSPNVLIQTCSPIADQTLKQLIEPKQVLLECKGHYCGLPQPAQEALIQLFKPGCS